MQGICCAAVCHEHTGDSKVRKFSTTKYSNDHGWLMFKLQCIIIL